MATFLQETFTAADGTALLGKSADIGGTWAAAGFNLSNGTIVSNAFNGGTSGVQSLYNTQTAGSQNATVTWKAKKKATGTTVDAYFGLRFDPSTKNGYIASLNGDGSFVDMYRVVNGVPTNVANLAVAWPGYLPATGEVVLQKLTVTKVGTTAVLNFSLQRLVDNLWMQPDGTFGATQAVCLAYTDTAPFEPTAGGCVFCWIDPGSSVDDVVGTNAATSSFTVTPGTIPKNHGGNIVLTLTGTGTTWSSGSTVFSLSGLTGATKISQAVVNGTSATLTITTGSSAGSLTISDGASSTVITVATANLSITPNTGAPNTTPTLTLTGTNTLWSTETSTGLFTVSGGVGSSIATPIITSDTAGTVTLTVGSSTGTLTITDTSTGATVTFTASSTFSASIVTATPSETGVALSITPGGGTPNYTAAFHRGTTANFTAGGGTLLGNVSGSGTLSLNDTTGTAGTLYYYRVILTDSASGSITSQTVGAARRSASVAVVWLGDSNMAGANVTNAATQAPPVHGAALIAARANRVVASANNGVGGSTSAGWVAGSTNLNNTLSAMAGLTGTVKVFMVSIGTNDIVSSVPAATYKTNVLSIIAGIRASYPTAYIFLCTPIYTSPGANNGTLYTNTDLLTQYRSQLQSILSTSTDVNLYLGDLTALETTADHTVDWFATETFASGSFVGQKFYLHLNDTGSRYWGEMMGVRLCTILNREILSGGINGTGILGMI